MLTTAGFTRLEKHFFFGCFKKKLKTCFKMDAPREMVAEFEENLAVSAGTYALLPKTRRQSALQVTEPLEKKSKK